MRALLFVALLPMHPLMAQSPLTIELEPFATGLVDIVDMAHAGDDRLFAVLQNGYIHVVNADGSVLPTPFLDIDDRVSSGGERGLLGLAFDPDYADNGFFYVNYSFGNSPGSTRISRFQVTADPNLADTAEQVLYTWPQPASNHKGGDLDFGPDGLLYIPLGDGGNSSNAQDLSDPLGDIIRIDVSDPDTTFTVPPTNPFVGASSDTLPEIWASGLRNPFRFGFDALTGDIWLGDVGASTYEEIDLWPSSDNSGPNFGWSCYEGNAPYNAGGCEPQSEYVAPVTVHPQSEQNWCSIMGGRVYRGSASQRLQGWYIYTDYCGGQFHALQLDPDQGWVRVEVRPISQYGFTCIAENSALDLFVGDKSDGTIHRIVDPCPMDAPVVTQEEELLTSSEATGNQWFLNGEPIPGATGQTYTILASGAYYVVADMGGGCELASETIVYVWTSIGTRELSSVSVHPVPADERLVVEGLPMEVITIDLVDMAGRRVATANTAGNARMVLQVNDIASGSYALVLRDGASRVLGQRPVSVQR